MIPIKIECSCGQHYSFDVEPVDGHMPAAVACPICGVDGTQAANAYIEGGLPAPTVPSPPAASPPPPPPPPAAPPANEPVRVPLQRPTQQQGGGIPLSTANKEQVRAEAKAKLFWGDKPEEVIKYLMMNRVNAQEASAMVREMGVERAAVIRKRGIWKVVIGLVLISIPTMTWIAMARADHFSYRIFGFTCAFGLIGAWFLLDGGVMALSPKSERGDITSK